MIKQRSNVSSFACLALRAFVAAAMASALSWATPARAQEGTDDIENLFNKEDQSPAPEVNETPIETKAPSAPIGDLKEVKDLEKLSEFKDIAVIQKRYLPKTGRFELYAAPALILNEAFFLNFGLTGRFAYYFKERYGVEFTYTGLTTSERQVTTDLREKRKVTTTSLVTPKSFMGIDFKWSPIYGKMSWRNKSITPFDMYFSFGGGMTSTNQGKSEPTFHFGTGQIFALGKGTAVRWDFSWNTFSSTSSATGSTASGLYNNLMFSLGLSFFFPEATYR
jgi:outer membrane beta-barrel protein